MNVGQQIRILRSQLFEMSRLSQQAVGYAIKAYEMRNKEVCSYVRDLEYKLVELHSSTADRCRKLLATGLLVDSDLRFVLSSLRISRALYRVNSEAVEIAQNILLAFRDDHIAQVPASLVLKEMGQTVDRFMRLCTDALCQEEVQHAEKSVPKNDECRRCFLLVAGHAYDGINRQIEAQNTFELAIARSLAKIVEQIQKIAAAVRFWLEGNHQSNIMRQPVTDVLFELLFEQKREDVMDAFSIQCCYSPHSGSAPHDPASINFDVSAEAPT
jgi:phosphate uptake regulator